MATKSPSTARKQATPADEDIHDAIDLSEVLDAEELNPAVQALQEELGGDIASKCVVYISKMITDSNKEARVWQGPPEEYDLMSIAKKFGSGDYRVRLYAPNGKYGRAIRGSQLFPVLLDPTDDARIALTRSGQVGQVAGITSAAPQASGVSAEQVAQMIAAAFDRIKPSQPDPFAQFERMATAFKAMMPSAPQTLGIADIINTARALVDVSRPAGGKEPAGDSNPEDYALKRGVDLVANLFEEHKRNTTTRALPAPAAGAGEAQVQQPVEDDDMLMLKLQLRQAVKAAKAGANPEEFAGDVYDMIPDEMLVMMSSDAQWFDKVCGFVPEAREVHEWFGKVKDALVAFAREDNVLPALPAAADSGKVAGGDNPTAGTIAGNGAGGAKSA